MAPLNQISWTLPVVTTLEAFGALDVPNPQLRPNLQSHHQQQAKPVTPW
ncbi:Protein of unknown function [Pyronema omphalodes CBS 100304]|uniref:Uncharacterized protein n=1 Tax=Pyronema omphalodes (strain CBS 100304) TaxID=1076935 RepID=U4LIG4_PYROM|nr:Protein of unknown function [Pyronema omphalodes CBS 100304]